MCPDDGGEMVKEIVQDAFIIDQCPSCGGVWLDGRDIELLDKLIAVEKKISESEGGPLALVIRGIVGKSE